MIASHFEVRSVTAVEPSRQTRGGLARSSGEAGAGLQPTQEDALVAAAVRPNLHPPRTVGRPLSVYGTDGGPVRSARDAAGHPR